jgi:dynein heavy chain, axonemal
MCVHGPYCGGANTRATPRRRQVELGDEEVKANLALHMAEEHLSVTHASKEYFDTQRRYNYVTPKSYLELIGFYKFLLDQKRSEVQRQIDRLDVGLSTLRKTAADVAELQVTAPP